MTRELALLIMFAAMNEMECDCMGCNSDLYRNFFWDWTGVRSIVVPMFIMG